MHRRTHLSPIILLVGALLLSSCGGSSQASTQSSPTVPTQSAGSVRPTPAVPATTESRVTAAAQPSSVASAPAQPMAVAATLEQPVVPERNPAGDIPDTQVFVRYAAPGRFSLEVPEGWARSTSSSDVRFVDKLDGVQVVISDTTSAPTAHSVRTHEAVALAQSGRAVTVSDIMDVKLPSGPAVLIVYTSNSDPNPVTNKQVRLEDNQYLFFKDGKLATLTLWAPQGADNGDQWQRIAQSFRWQ